MNFRERLTFAKRNSECLTDAKQQFTTTITAATRCETDQFKYIVFDISMGEWAKTERSHLRVGFSSVKRAIEKESKRVWANV